ncbi:MAG: AAA family ATPase [Candidatus Nezhaarchaeota archaeon]|nr:AAA family ATPase [Candidatus Nezhaarchaeota archaeon]
MGFLGIPLRAKMYDYAKVLELERELIRKERQIEYLQLELKRYQTAIEELRQGMRPVGLVQDVVESNAYVRLEAGQLYEVTIPPNLKDKVQPGLLVVLTPNKGAVLNVVERRLTEKDLWSLKIEKNINVFYEDVVGLDKELKELRKAVEWVLSPAIRHKRESIVRDSRLLEEAGTVLLFGPPGTGKTYMAKAVAGSLNKYGQRTAFIKVEAYELVSKWLGESARNVRELFRLARGEAPCILFIDEVDAIARARTEITSDAGRDVQGMLNQLLTEIGEGFHANKDMAIIFATNLPSVIDPALLDRIRKVIYVPPPRSKEDVKKLFDFYLSKVSVDPNIWKDGKMTMDAFEELWKLIRSRRLIYEVSIQPRNIKVFDEYWITPRDIKNIVQEAASDAAFQEEEHVTLERLVEYVKGLISEKPSHMSFL